MISHERELITTSSSEEVLQGVVSSLGHLGMLREQLGVDIPPEAGETMAELARRLYLLHGSLTNLLEPNSRGSLFGERVELRLIEPSEVSTNNPFTKMQMAVLQGKVDGLTNEQIANGLNRTIPGIEYHVNRIRLLVRSREDSHVSDETVQAIVMAVENGWVNTCNLPRVERLRFLPGQKRALELVYQGKSNKEIAEETGVVLATVEFYISGMNKEISTKSRYQLAAWVAREYREYREYRGFREPSCRNIGRFIEKEF